MIIGIDFDGTCVEHKFPEVGEDVPYSVHALKELVKQGHQLILWTVRSDKYIDDAVWWFKRNGIELWGVNENPTQKDWSPSNKAYAALYIDDAAFGAPLRNGHHCPRPMLDWIPVMNHFGITPP